jgi:hypothetical protein
LCDLNQLFGLLQGLSYIPAGVPVPPCQCETDAGTVQPSTFNVCVTGNVTAPFNNDETLDGNDLLQFILFSDPLDTLGSIIATSNSPTFNFDPTLMQTGITYYLATIAGDNLNGNVDLSDDCLSISNAAEVVWQPLPTVNLTTTNPNLCAGNCLNLNVEFTGTAPYNLQGDIILNNVLVSTFNETYNANVGILEVCIPIGTPIGNLTIESTQLSDSFCACQ